MNVRIAALIGGFDTLHHDLNVPYVRDEIKRLSQRYADRLEERPNTIDLMSDAETPRELKRKLKTCVSNCTVNYNL